jgi:hypothetical protein
MFTRNEATSEEQPYWTHDTALFSGRFRYFSRELTPVAVRGKIHLSQEPYRLQPKATDIEPIKQLTGTRSYVHMNPFVLVPDIILTIGLYPEPKQYADQDSAIGEVIAAQERKLKEVEIGQAQAWYYPADKTIIVWECLLHHFVQEKPLLEDHNMTDYWQGFERFLQQHFPNAAQIATPYHDPEYEFTEYQQFLTTLGYRPHESARAAWSKPIARGE